MSIWSSVWPSVDRHSLQYFKYTIDELRQIDIMHKYNREVVTNLLQSIVEIVTYGDRHDPLIFEYFMEYQVLAEFVRVLRISRNSNIEAPLLQYLSIMIQNMSSEHAIYYCLSNGYVNSIIEHKYDFDAADLASYYISFLRAVSSKINRDTLCLIVKVDRDVVTAFPLYSEALKFAQHEDMMIQTAVRALTLNIFNDSDEMVFQFITSPPASKYFSDLVYSLREKCICLDGLIQDTEQTCSQQRKNDILQESDKIVDDLYYFKDILSVGEPRLSKVVIQNLLSLLVFPILLPFLQLRESNGFHISTITSLYIVSHLLQVVGGKTICNCIAGVLLYPYMTSRTRDPTEVYTANGISSAHPLSGILNDMEVMDIFAAESEGEENSKNYTSGQLAEYISSISQFGSFPVEKDVFRERSGMLAHIFSDNYNLLLASVFLLLILAESTDLDYLLASVVGRSKMQDLTISASQVENGHILERLMPQVLSALLKVLASQPQSYSLMKWHAGWLLHNLLVSQEKILSDHNLNLFNTSYRQSSERLHKELEGCWFDHILDTIREERANCKTVLEEPLKSKNPLFLIELALNQQTTYGADYDGNTASDISWKTMVDTVKVFVLHLQLKTLIVKGNFPEKSLLDFGNLTTDTGTSPSSVLSSASFGSEVSLGSGIPCRIAFSNAGVRDIYLVPVSRGTTGKLILAEKHPFRSQRGVVIAIAPLAGLTPEIDENHPTWLHLQIREFDPRYGVNKKRSHSSKMSSSSAVDGRWTIGFSTGKACEAARLQILEETRKQRSFVETIVAPLLKDNYIEELSDSQAG